MSESNAASRPASAPLAVHVAGVPLDRDGSPVQGSFVQLDGHDAYRIDHVDGLDPFFVTVVSDVDHWLFASSTGGLTAGRGVPERALFPYETVDRIHDAQDRTGSKTVLLVERDRRWELWEPFSTRYAGMHAVRRSLTKTLQGDRLQYREVNDDLGLSVAVTWSTSERYGFVKTTEVRNHRDQKARVRVLDGVQNLMPYGVSRDLQETRSVLANAYKKNELVPGTTLGSVHLERDPRGPRRAQRSAQGHDRVVGRDRARRRPALDAPARPLPRGPSRSRPRPPSRPSGGPTSSPAP